jgi:glycosyltransferase involved in cell wall biosynthesis
MSSMEPNILYLCAACPFSQEAFGGALRSRLVAEGLQMVGRVTIVPVSRWRWPERDLDAVKQQFPVTAEVLQLRQRRRLLVTMLRNVSARCMNTDDRATTAADRAMIATLASEADLVWIEEVGIADSLGIWRWRRAVLDADDLMSRYYLGRFRCEQGRERLRALWHSHRWRRREARFIERFDRVVVCSEDDRRYLGSHTRLPLIPNSFECRAPATRRAPVVPPRFGFIGTLRWPPNDDGVRWFGREVMPLISRTCPGAEFRLVGRGGAEFLEQHRLPGTPLGYLDDPTDEMATWTAMVVPIRFGGGTRVKIAEGFARGIPVVSTRAGAFGYEVEDRRELMLADTPADFARACKALAEHPELAAALTNHAASCLAQHYSPESVRERVRRLACDVLAAAAREGSREREAYA